MNGELEMTSIRADELLRGPAADRGGMSEGDIITAWSRWLYDRHGVGLSEDVLNIVYGKAWEDGHSAGLQEVESCFIDLVDLAEMVIAAVR